MAWVKVPAAHHPIFRDALPDDRRVSTQLMFGGVAARVNGHIFAGLFGRSVVVELDEPAREEALALEGAGPFDPMGDGRRMSHKVMLPEAFMDEPDELRGWIERAFAHALGRPPKAARPARQAAKPTKPARQAVKPTKPARQAVKPTKPAPKTAAKPTKPARQAAKPTKPAARTAKRPAARR